MLKVTIYRKKQLYIWEWCGRKERDMKGGETVDWNDAYVIVWKVNEYGTGMYETVKVVRVLLTYWYC